MGLGNPHAARYSGCMMERAEARASDLSGASPPLGVQSHLCAASWDGLLRDAASDVASTGTGMPLGALDALPPEVSALIESMRPLFKPQGGFWTSTADGSGVSAWERCERDFLRSGARQDRLLYEVTGRPRILVLRDDRDVTAATGVPEGHPVGMRVAEAFWRRAPSEWDAVHVPADHVHDSCLNSWDTESTVWFRPDLFLAEIGRSAVHRMRRRRSGAGA